MPMQLSSRRSFLQSTSLSLAWASTNPLLRFSSPPESTANRPLDEFGYGDVALSSDLHEHQLKNTHSVLMNLSEDSMLKPLRQMSGLPAPGDALDGWYLYDPDYDKHKGDTGFAPACTFGQWISALARSYAIQPDPAVREKVLRLNRLFAQSITGNFYENNRFPAYCYDKFVCGLIDSHQFVHDPDALAILDHTTDLALPHLPKTAIEHDVSWRPGTDETYTWDESYTISENLFLAFQRGAGSRYKQLGLQYLDDLYYNPLSEGRNNLAGRHAYSHVNSLCSAMQAYLTAGSEKHLRAAKNGFDMLLAQSYATGGWGPDETLRAPESDDLFASLSNTHNTFETPCGSYAHFKLTRYLLRVTRDSLYGDSMERVMYNTILGAKPLQPDGRTFYYSDYNFDGKKVYKEAHWPCCSGTMPQIAADYRISTYFRDPSSVYVNLYIPSTLRWIQDGSRFTLKQTTAYPLDSALQFELQAAQSKTFELHFRIPAWTESPALLVNGKRTTAPVVPGTFASIEREWKNGDQIELDLPMKTRLEPIDKRHADTVALLKGPLVLFGINAAARTFTRTQLLAAEQTSPNSWQAGTSANPLVLRPFFGLAAQPYSTYFKLS
jgi:uncharacterized protein